MLTIIDKYIGKFYIGYFISGLVVFVTIFLAVDFMNSLVTNDAPIDVMIRYYGFSLLAIVHQMIPVACLMATIFTLFSLNKTQELTALFSSGYSLARVSAPILVLVSLISVVAFWFNDRVLPSFAQKKNYVYYVEILKKPGLYSTVKTNKIWYRSENILFNIQTLNPQESLAQGITLYYLDDKWSLVQLIQANTVKFTDKSWELKKGTVTLLPDEASFPLTRDFDTKVISMNENPVDVNSTFSSSDVMSLSELKRFIKKNKEAGLETTSYEVDYHGRFGFALAAFVMSLMGIPFSVNRQRSGGGIKNVGVVVGFAFLYWAFYSSFITMGRHGLLPPVISAWASNILMVIMSLYFLVKLKK